MCECKGVLVSLSRAESGLAGLTMLMELVCDPSSISPFDRGLGQRYADPSHPVEAMKA